MFALIFLLFSCTDYSVIIDEYAGEVWVDSFIQTGDASGVDIVWAIDRSGSMHDNDEKLVDGISAMMNSLPTDIGWRIGIISADENESIVNSEFPLVPGDTPSDAEIMINNLNNHWNTLEAGFDSVVSYVDYGAYASTWMRHDASLLVVFVSDEDDQSYMTSTEFISWIKGKRSISYIASIVTTENSDCEGAYGTGYNYMHASNAVNGVIVDICSDDWSPGVQDATNKLEPIEEMPLTHVPLEDSIAVFVNSIKFNDWSYDPEENIIKFLTIPSGGDWVEIGYNIST